MKNETKEIIVYGKDITDMKWPELQRFIVEMTNELLLERGERTKTRKECDIMRTCWGNTEIEVEETKAKLLKKYLEGDALWDKYKAPYAENESKITYQKFITNYAILHDERENRKRIENVNKKWDKEVLPKLMEAKVRDIRRFDQKEKDLKAEYADVQVEHQKILDEAVKTLDEKLLDWRVALYKRISTRRNYDEFQYVLKQLYYSEQKNLLVHELDASHKVNFDKIRGFIRERIEGDLVHIATLTKEIDKLQNIFQSTSNEIVHYKALTKEKKVECEKNNKALQLYELKFKTYQRNICNVTRGSNKLTKLKMDKVSYVKRRKELEDEVMRRINAMSMYEYLVCFVQDETKTLREKLLCKEPVMNLMKFVENVPESEKSATEKYFEEKKAIEELLFLITRELKGHNDFKEAVVPKLAAIGLPKVPHFLRVSHELFPTGVGPAGLTTIECD